MIKPLASKIAVKRIEAVKQSAGGIYLQRTEEPDRAEVVALGPKVTEVEVGDVVLLNWNGAIKSGEDDLFVIDIEHVIFIYGEE
jgi:co-chaperonin GroES (HSP10)